MEKEFLKMQDDKFTGSGLNTENKDRALWVYL